MGLDILSAVGARGAMAAQLTFNQLVAGSNPAVLTRLPFFCGISPFVRNLLDKRGGGYISHIEM